MYGKLTHKLVNPGEGDTSYNGPDTGRSRPKGVPFFRLQVNEKVGISPLKYRKLEKSVFLVSEKG